jgi:hypothetical protein
MRILRIFLQTLLYTLLVLVVAMLTACGQSEDDKFLTELRDWYGKNNALFAMDIRKEVVEDLSLIVPTEKYEEDFRKFFHAHESLLAAKNDIDYIEPIEQKQWRRRGNGYVASCHHIAIDLIVRLEASSEYVAACSKRNQVKHEAMLEAAKWYAIFVREDIPWSGR